LCKTAKYIAQMDVLEIAELCTQAQTDNGIRWYRCPEERRNIDMRMQHLGEGAL